MEQKNKTTRNVIKALNDEFYAKTKKYQKIYGFDIGTGKSDTWNNESDAFKHAFMQAIIQFEWGNLASNTVSILHEIDGNINNNQDKSEENMDLWNNAIGREIGRKIKHTVMLKKKSDYPKEKIEDMIAEEIVKRMKKGDLITNPGDKRSYLKKIRGSQTGFAVNIPENKIFTAEEIDKMPLDEFEKYEAYIDNQMKEFGIPKNYQANEEIIKGSMIWVDSYTREDGTQVKGYYRRK